MPAGGAPDLVVVGAGVLGTWTALRAVERGRTVQLLDAFGPGDARATSGDESRITRASHGTDGLYATWSREALQAWRRLGDDVGRPLVEPCGVAWFAGTVDGFEAASETALRSLGIPVERLSPAEASRRWPIRTEDLAFVLHEPEGGVIRARTGVMAAAEVFRRRGGTIDLGRARPGAVDGRRLRDLVLDDGRRVTAGTFVVAAGPWLTRLFPAIVGPILSVTRQDVLYVGTPAGDGRWSSAELPACIDYDGAFYGIPGMDGRGFKVASDAYGPPVDPDLLDRVVDPSSIAAVREYLTNRFPGLTGSPIVETRVCQYETTPDTHWLIDRHPAFDNVWLVGGGSGHAFKHGPRIGQYVVDRLDGIQDIEVDERFSITRPRDPSHYGVPPARPAPPARPDPPAR